MQGVKQQGIWLAVAVVAGAGIAIIATLMVAGHLRQQELSDAVAAQTAHAEENARRAKEAANRAHRAREEAEDLVGFFLKELRSELEPIGRVAVYEKAAERAVSYYDSLPPDLITPETLASHATVLMQLSQARYDRGDVAGAVRAVESCVAVARRVVESVGDDESRLELACALKESGLLLNANHDPAAGREAFLDSLQILQSLPDRDSAGVTSGLAAAYYGLGEIERFGDNPAAALAEYERAAELLEKALAADPDHLRSLQSLMTVHNNAGYVQMTGPDLEGAERAYLKSLDVARRIAELDPGNRNHGKEIATLLNNLGTLLDEREDYPRAEALLREANAMREALVAWDPRNARWLADLANSAHNLASLHFDLAQYDEALGEARRSLQLYCKLVALEPDTPAWVAEFKGSLDADRARLREAGREQDALALYDDIMLFAKKLESQGPGGGAWEGLIASLHGEVGRLSGDVGDHAAAIEEARRSAATEAAAFARLPGAVDTTYDLALAYSELGDAHRDGGDPAAALLCFSLSRFLLSERVGHGFSRREMFLDEAEQNQLRALVELKRRDRPAVALPRGAEWSYWDSRSSPGENWADPGFDDSGWARGPAKLGYGEGDEGTRLSFGDDQDNKNVTAWFRRAVDLPEAAAITSLRFHLLQDDGAVVYLNGREVFRTGMPPGEITPTTYASITVMNWAESIYRAYTFPAAGLPLRDGPNLVAVEVHQNEAPSSDLTFDLEILPDYQSPPPLEGFDLQSAKELLGDALPEELTTLLKARAASPRP